MKSIVFALLLLSPTAFAAKPSSLCGLDEEILFSCEMKGKTLSLCGAQGFSSKGGKLQYRFGRKDKIEFQFPDQPRPAKGYFFASQTTYSGGGESRIRFQNGEWEYVLFDSMIRTGFDGKGNRPKFSTGLALNKNKKTISVSNCKSQPIFEHASLAFIPSEEFDDLLYETPR